MLYEKKYVKKRKRKIAAAIVGFVCSISVGALVIVSFLGRYTGTFTVTLDEKNVNLALSQKQDFVESTSVLIINYLPAYHETTYSQIKSIENELDSEETDYLHGANFYVDEQGVEHKDTVESLNYFKYTFYVKNVGSIPARYDFRINILENTPDTATGTRYLDDLVRIALYENDPTSEERSEPTVYAKTSAIANRDENGEVTYKEYISTSKDREDEDNPCYGFAEEFQSPTRVMGKSYSNFAVGQMKRYTIVTWLEGEDPQSDNNKKAPKGAKLKLGVEINAYENE